MFTARKLSPYCQNQEYTLPETFPGRGVGSTGKYCLQLHADLGWRPCCIRKGLQAAPLSTGKHLWEIREVQHQVGPSLRGNCPTRFIWVLTDTYPRARSTQDCFLLQVLTSWVDSDDVWAEKRSRLFSKSYWFPEKSSECFSGYYGNKRSKRKSFSAESLIRCSHCWITYSYWDGSLVSKVFFERWGSSFIQRNSIYFFEKSGFWVIYLLYKV